MCVWLCVWLCAWMHDVWQLRLVWTCWCATRNQSVGATCSYRLSRLTHLLQPLSVPVQRICTALPRPGMRATAAETVNAGCCIYSLGPIQADMHEATHCAGHKLPGRHSAEATRWRSNLLRAGVGTFQCVQLFVELGLQPVPARHGSPRGPAAACRQLHLTCSCGAYCSTPLN